MTRPAIDAVMMQTAQAWAGRGTCSRLQVGAVAARYGRVIVTGYNGTVSGASHCDHTCDCAPFPVENTNPDFHYLKCRSQQRCGESVHAEANVVAFAARLGLPLYDSTLYCTHAPCIDCARLLVNAGVATVIFHKGYRSCDGLELLIENGVEVGPWMQED